MIGVLLSMAGVAVAAATSGDGLVVVVSAQSRVTTIPRLHLEDIYLGRATRFPNGEPVEPIDQKSGSEAWKTFYETYLGRSPAQIKAHWSKLIFTGRGRPPREAASGREVRELVAADSRVIGYIDSDLVDESVRVVSVE